MRNTNNYTPSLMKPPGKSFNGRDLYNDQSMKVSSGADVADTATLNGINLNHAYAVATVIGVDANGDSVAVSNGTSLRSNKSLVFLQGCGWE